MLYELFIILIHYLIVHEFMYIYQ